MDQYLILSSYLRKIDIPAAAYAKEFASAVAANDAKAEFVAERKLNNRLREIGVVWQKYDMQL